MKICPRCNREYAEVLENCLVCGANLTTYTPILSEEEREVLELNRAEETVSEPEIPAENAPELICSVLGKEEGVRLAALLQEHRIPCMCKENEEEENLFDLFVPKHCFNQAFALLQEDEEALEQQEEEEVDFEEEQPAKEEQPTPPKKKKGLFGFFGKKEK